MDAWKILEGPLTSSPIAAVMSVALWKLWDKLKEREALIAQKDAQIAALNEKRISDLQQILKQDD